jgi:hypothetical protein
MIKLKNILLESSSKYKNIVYHGTQKRFVKFEKSSRGSYGKGFYFFKRESSTAAYGNIVIKALVDIRNPFYLNGDTFPEWSKLYFDKNISKMTSKLQKAGYDGVITVNEIVVFDNSQIKVIEDNI